MEYGICDVIGSGTVSNPYRPLIADYGSSYVSIIPDDYRCAFIKAQGGDLVGASNDAGIFHITLNLNDILTSGQATFTNNKFNRWSITTRASAGQTVKQVLINVIKELDVGAEFKNYLINGQE